MTVDVRPKGAAQEIRELSKRLYRVEQESSRPAEGIASAGMGSDPVVNTITVGGIVVGSAASPATNLTLSTGAFMEDIWIDADWDAPADGTASNYDVELARKVGGVFELVQNFHLGGGTSIRMAALEPNQDYGVRVTAINRIGARASRLPATGWAEITTTIDATLPSQVTGVTAVAGISSVTVVWAENPERDVKSGNGTYEVTISPAADFSNPTVTFTSGTVVSFTFLASGTQYWVRVRAVDSSGNAGPWSTTATATTERVESVDISDAAVVTSKLANLAVDNAKLGNLAVDAAKLANSSVESTKIANLAVGSAAIAALAVGTAKIADLAVVTAKIGELAVTTAKINDLAVTNAKIANLAVDDAKIASLDAGKITAGTISADRIAANSLSAEKLSTSTLTSKTITIGAGGVLKIGDAPTTGILINDQGIRLYSGSAVKVALDVAGTATFEGNISASTITSSTITSVTINSGTITGATVRTAASGERIALEAGVIDQVRLYTGAVSETAPGSLNIGTGTNELQMWMASPNGNKDRCEFIMTAPTVDAGSPTLIWSIRTPAGATKSKFAFSGGPIGGDSFVETGPISHMLLDFIRAGTNAQAMLKGSGDYGFLQLYGGGASATLNVNIGLGTGFSVLDGANGPFRPINASAFNVSSARRTKENVRNEGEALSRLQRLVVKRFNRIQGERIENPPPHVQREYDMEEIGLIADELLQVVPEAVVLDGDQQPLAINLGVVVALLVKSVQELNERIRRP